MKIDSHAHVFLKSLPQVQGRRYEPSTDAPLRTYLEQLRVNGVSHGVLVQPSFLGTDNSFLLQSLSDAGGCLRGVVVVDPTTSDDALLRMHDAGAVGIRLNFIGKAIPDLRLPVWETLFAFIRRHEWHVEVHAMARDLPDILGPLLKVDVKIVVDHFGRPDPTLGTKDPGFKYLVGLAATQRVWIKASAGYRLGGTDSDLPARAAAGLRDAFGTERLVWGSDWPHTMHESQIRYADTLANLKLWGFDERAQELILQTTPAQLFHFDKQGCKT